MISCCLMTLPVLIAETVPIQTIVSPQDPVLGRAVIIIILHHHGFNQECLARATADTDSNTEPCSTSDSHWSLQQNTITTKLPSGKI